ncbi:MAG: CvpA family protein [Verrucomicrobiota bacterium]|nr:CvpA family protein [Verrucomicrobiota bacterium]
MKPDIVSGSPLWQAVFISFAAVLMLFQIARGWRLGLPRQLVRIAAVVSAYSAALWGGEALLPLLRPLLKVPDFVLSALGGAVLAMIIYSVINTVGAILFKRTGQQSSSAVRLLFGGSGALLGIFFGLFFVWLLVAGVRSLGAIAEAEINATASRGISKFEEPAARSRRGPRAVVDVDQDSLVFSFARLKKSIELGTFGELVKRTDVLPGGIYETLGHVGEVFAQPERAARFLGYPGVTDLMDNPKILALRADPEIANMIQQGRVLDLLQDERLVETMNDPELRAELKKLNFKAALDHALKHE